MYFCCCYLIAVVSTVTGTDQSVYYVRIDRWALTVHFGQMNPLMFSTTPSSGSLTFSQNANSFRTSCSDTSWNRETMSWSRLQLNTHTHMHTHTHLEQGNNVMVEVRVKHTCTCTHTHTYLEQGNNVMVEVTVKHTCTCTCTHTHTHTHT